LLSIPKAENSWTVVFAEGYRKILVMKMMIYQQKIVFWLLSSNRFSLEGGEVMSLISSLDCKSDGFGFLPTF
jgi:hypothetical protein